MTLIISYETGGDWIPVPKEALRKWQQDPFLGRYLKRCLSDGKVEVFDDYSKHVVAEAAEQFLRQRRKLVKEGHYVLIEEESSDHRDEGTGREPDGAGDPSQ